MTSNGPQGTAVPAHPGSVGVAWGEGGWAGTVAGLLASPGILMGHSHAHGPAHPRPGERHRHRLALAFVLIAAFFVVEAVAGFLTNSLALLSDAGHMLTDVVGLGMALAAIQLATRFARKHPTATSSHTFGLYRLEILAAFVNALLLFGVAIWVLVEATRRMFDQPHVLSTEMLVVASLGLAVNIVAFLLLRGGAKESLNVKAAYLEVVADTVGSVGVIIAAILVNVFRAPWIDPVMGALIGLWILPRTWRLGREAVRILLQAAPEHIDVRALRDDLLSIEQVVGVHHLHVWTLTSDMHAASAHLVTAKDADAYSVLQRARSLVAQQYGIDHGTFQVEPDSLEVCDDAHVGW